MLKVWILVIFISGYDAPPVAIATYRTAATCEAAGAVWRGKKPRTLIYRCIPARSLAEVL